MQRADVDGVPVLWADGPPPFTAGLVLGVGRADEAFLQGGVTHLLEHLVMGSLGRSTLDANATVDLDTTQFLATGRPERVAAFLEQVCRALTDVPVDRLAVEAQVLRAEEGHVAPPAVEALLGERYGADGVGLAGYRDPALLSLTADDVRGWAERHVRRDAAAVWMSGPPPEGLRLPLPGRPAPAPRRQARRDLVLPALVEVPSDGVALGGEVDRLPGLGAALRVLADRVEDDLRHRRGLSYTVATEQVVVEGDRRFVAVTADVRDGQEAVAARALWQGLTRLAAEGPDDAELAHDRDGLAEHLADPRSGVEEVHAAAVALVRGRPARTSDDLWREALAVGREDVRQAAEQLRDAALLAVPFGTDPGLPGLTPVPAWSSDVVQGRVFPRRRRGDAPRGAQLVVGDDGASVVLSADERLTVRYADAAALLETADGSLLLSGRSGWSVPLAASDWRDGEEALELVRAAVPGELHAREDALAPSGRSVVLVHAPPHRVAESLWPAERDAHVLATPEWTLVVRPHDEQETYLEAAGISGALGRKGTVLQLVLAHGELSVTVLARGQERDRHVWTGDPHDPAVLADLLGHDPEDVAALLALDGTPEQVLAALEPVLGVPPQAAQVLLGAEPEQVDGLVLEPARGLREDFRAAVRGDYDPPDGDALHQRISRWERERPPGYRLVHVGLAAGQAAAATGLGLAADGDLTSWRGALAALLGLGALSSAWDARPRKR